MRQGEAHIRRPSQTYGHPSVNKSIRLPDKYILHTRHLLVEVRQDDSHLNANTCPSSQPHQGMTQLVRTTCSRTIAKRIDGSPHDQVQSQLFTIGSQNTSSLEMVDTIGAYIAIVHCRTHIHYSRHQEVSSPSEHACSCTHCHGARAQGYVFMHFNWTC